MSHRHSIKPQAQPISSQSSDNNTDQKNRYLALVEKAAVKFNDHKVVEDSIANNYSSFLDHPDILKELDITQHHRILSIATNKLGLSFPFDKFINFILKSITEYEIYEMQTLLVYFNKTDFSTNLCYQLENHTEFDPNYLTFRDDRYFEVFEQQNYLQARFNRLEKIVLPLSVQTQNEIEELKKQINQLEQKNDEYKNTNQILQVRLSKKETIINTYQTRISQLEQEKKQCNNENKILQEKLSQREKLLETNKTRISQLEQENEQCKNENKALQEELSQREKLLETNKTRISQLEQENEQCKNENKALQEELSQNETIINTHQSRISQLEQENEQCKNENKALQEELSQREKLLETNNTRISQLEQENESCKNENKALRHKLSPKAKCKMPKKSPNSELQTNVKEPTHQVNSVRVLIDPTDATKAGSKPMGMIKNVAKPIRAKSLGIPKKSSMYTIINIPYDQNSPFNGILRYLSTDRVSNTKLKLNQLLELKSGKPEQNSDRTVYNLIDYTNSNETFYASKSESKQNWIIFHFINSSVDLEGYEITSYCSGKNCYHPKTFEIQGSNDNSEWDRLDRRENCSGLNDKSRSVFFECNSPTHKFYKYIRFYQIEHWRSGANDPFTIRLSRFELYGKWRHQ